MKDDKIKPIEERIAELFGRTIFKDMREGFGGAGPEITSADIARALGVIADEHGNLVPLVLETKYGATLMHERTLCTGWELFAKKSDPSMTRETILFSRMACTFAVRELASGKKAKSEIITHFAWMAGVRRQSLEAAIWLVASWFDDLARIGERSMRDLFKNAA